MTAPIVPSPFKRFRLQTQPEPATTFGMNPGTGFDVDRDLGDGKVPYLDERLDNAQAAGDAADAAKQPYGSNADYFAASLQGLGAGIAAGAGNNEGLNFGQSFARGLGAAASTTEGSMDKIHARRAAEEDRVREISKDFFDRSMTLRKLSLDQRKADIDEAHNRASEAHLANRDRYYDDRMDLQDRQFGQLVHHQGVMEGVAQQNANANTSRAGTFALRGLQANDRGALKQRQKDIDAYVAASRGDSSKALMAYLSDHNVGLPETPEAAQQLSELTTQFRSSSQLYRNKTISTSITSLGDTTRTFRGTSGTPKQAATENSPNGVPDRPTGIFPPSEHRKTSWY